MPLLKCLGFLSHDDATFATISSNVWLGSANVPVNGEGSAEKGFEHTDCSFSHMNRTHFPKVMRARSDKTCDPSKLVTKGIYCKLRCAIEVNFRF